jgi:hypothetical protein
MPESPELPDDETIDIDPRPLGELVRRMLALLSVARRGMLEVDEERDLYERETDRFDWYSWARTELADTLTDTERLLLATPVGELGEADLDTCDDALIGASTIAWAVGLIAGDRLPVPSEGRTEEQVLAWAPEPWNPVEPLIGELWIRDDESFGAERERWEVWYWRANEAEPGEDGFSDVIAAVRETGLIPVAGDDLATDDGRSFEHLSAEDRATLATVSELRLLALNWACGFGRSWDDIPVYPD